MSKCLCDVTAVKAFRSPWPFLHSPSCPVWDGLEAEQQERQRLMDEKRLTREQAERMFDRAAGCGTQEPCSLSGSRNCDGDHPLNRCVGCGAWEGEDEDRDHTGGGCVR